MQLVDNRGRGNCMYYAYSISLMYYLRQQDDGVRDIIFNKLQLTVHHKEMLSKIFMDSRGSISQLTKHETDIIERILGPACRELAGNNTQEEFLVDPAGSSTVTAAVYGIACAFKQKLPPQYASLIMLPDARSQQSGASPVDSFIQAEIYKVEGIKAAMSEFAEHNANAVIQLFEHTNASRTHSLTQEMIMQDLIQEKTIEFLTANDNKQLNKYITRLKTDTVWGSDETLFSLHRAITGEKRNAQNLWVTDIAISLMILKDGRAQPWEKPEQCNIILNNEGNNHWVSSIPAAYLVQESKIKALTEFKLVLEAIIKRYNDFSSATSNTDSEAMAFITLLQKQTKELNELAQYYTNKKMNDFINGFSVQLNAAPVNALDNQYLSERISNFIMTSWHMIKIAFAALIAVVSPGSLKTLQANWPVPSGVKTDIKKAQALFGCFKPVDQIMDENKGPPKPTSQSGG